MSPKCKAVVGDHQVNVGDTKKELGRDFGPSSDL